MDLITILPNLGIGVVAILTLGFVAREFINHLKTIHTEHKSQLSELHTEHLRELKEREISLREVEKEVRTNVTGQLAKNTQIIERAIRILDKE